MNSVTLQHFGGANSLPGGGDLDQYALAANSLRVVLRDDAARLCDGGLCVVGEARVYFSGDAAGNNSQNFLAEGDGQPLKGEVGDSRAGRARAQFLARGKQHPVHNRLVLWQLRSGGNQRWVGGRILRAKLANRLNVARIGNNNRETAQLL